MKVLPMSVAAGLVDFVLILMADRPLPQAQTDQAKVSRSNDPSTKDKLSKRGTPTGEVQGGKGGSEFRNKTSGRLISTTGALVGPPFT